MGDRCKTRYPILLVHGTGVRDFKRVNVWGRVRAALEAEGARVFTGGQDAWATVETNARVLALRAGEVLEQAGAEKLHIIAHSKGGLDARRMICEGAMAGRVASLTTISSPHHGSRTMDLLLRMPRGLFHLGGFFVNGWYRLMGDQSPDFCGVCGQFTTAWAESFNEAHPDVEHVLYRSYAGVMTWSFSDLWMWWQHFIIKRVEGENDGLVSVESASWTNFGPLWRGPGRRGVSHMDEVDFRRRPLRKGKERIDPVDWYLNLVSELKDQDL